jgi:hypothetical protein
LGKPPAVVGYSGLFSFTSSFNIIMSSKLDDFFSKKNKKTKKNRTILTLAVEDEVEEKSSPSPANDSVTTEPLAWLPENKGTNIISSEEWEDTDSTPKDLSSLKIANLKFSIYQYFIL